jgi:hypothetical protein
MKDRGPEFKPQHCQKKKKKEKEKGEKAVSSTMSWLENIRGKLIKKSRPKESCQFVSIGLSDCIVEQSKYSECKQVASKYL